MDLAVNPTIDDTDLTRDAPYMRALLARRLELVWQACQPHVDGTVERNGYNVDVRFIIAGMQALKNLQRLYRLDQPTKSQDRQIAGTGPDTRALVAGYLDEVELRERPVT